MNREIKRILFALFFISGLCSLLYQVVWVRLAYARFGVNTPVLSVIVSVFMAGLALGSYLGGKKIAALSRVTGRSPAVFYAAAEILIGIGALAVPRLLAFGQTLLAGSGDAGSSVYLFLSALVIAVSLLPWCICMGTTFPFMMAYVRRIDPDGNGQSFSFLYTANVLGGLSGVLLTAAVWIESFGFSTTLLIAAALNAIIALVAFNLPGIPASAGVTETSAQTAPPRENARLTAALLFVTGFVSMGMEIVWTRAFTPFIGTQVYAFSFLLLGYLLATWTGSSLYRRHARKGLFVSPLTVLAVIAVSSFLPLVMNDPRLVTGVLHLKSFWARIGYIVASLFPFCAALGYLTPRLIDGASQGDPDAAGRLYALNVLGCIIGPLAVSYLLLPYCGVKASLILLALPFAVFLAAFFKRLPIAARAGLPATAALLLIAVFLSASAEVPAVGGVLVKRDYAATVACYGSDMRKRLLVNGVGITHLTPITKFMAHLPAAFLPKPPESSLVICFGMGTTFRSLLSHGSRVTAVELVPSVRDVFGYFFNDAAKLTADPRGRIIIDDGRRFLMRTQETFDIVTLDPPPPVEAAGSSLLYSEEFYDEVRRKLKTGGVLQQWYPSDDPLILNAVARALVNKFRYVKAFISVSGWGIHFIASDSPLKSPTAQEAVSRMPAAALSDISEWDSAISPEQYFKVALGNEIPVQFFLSRDTSITITDDRPYNEYFLLRSLFKQGNKRGVIRTDGTVI